MALHVLIDHGNDRTSMGVVGGSASCSSLEKMRDFRNRLNSVYHESHGQVEGRCQLYQLVPVDGADVPESLEGEQTDFPARRIGQITAEKESESQAPPPAVEEPPAPKKGLRRLRSFRKDDK